MADCSSDPCPGTSICLVYSLDLADGGTDYLPLCTANCDPAATDSCPSGQACNPLSPNPAEAGYCGFACSYASDCAGPTSTCTDGACHCASDGDCPTGLQCDPGSGACYQPCTDDAACGGFGCCAQTGALSYCDSSGTSGPAALHLDGTLTYDAVRSTDQGLDYNSVPQRPIRGARVQLLDAASGQLLAETYSGPAGAYAFDWDGPAQVKVRVLSQTGVPNIRVEDNTAGDALYAVDSSPVTATAGTTLDLNAGSGWGGSGYTGARAAAPFSVLDAAYSAAQAFLAVRSPNFPALRINWSVNNRPEPGDKAQGQIGTSHWDRSELYILGKEDVDTDEFDTHVTVHEWGHYFESKLSWSDNPGGSHAGGELKDPRLAFGEGWGNALSGIVLYPDSVYTDTFGVGQATGFGMDMEDNSDETNSGWFSEGSVQHILYDLFDPDPEPWDAVSLGLGPIYDVMTNQQRYTYALTTVFSFTAGLKQDNPAQAAAIDALLAHHGIDPVADEYGTGETHSGGFAGNLPVYNPATINGGPVNLSLLGGGPANALGQNRYVTFTGDGSQVTLSATSSSDVALTLYDFGFDVASADSFVSGTESLTYQTEAGEPYVLVVTGYEQAAGAYSAVVNVTSP